MIVDSSAVIAVLVDEEDADRFRRHLAGPGPKRLSVGTLVELQTVILRRMEVGALEDLDLMLAIAEVEMVPVTERQAQIAREGYVRFGRGAGGGRFGLNFGDCFTYALSIDTGLPILFKGKDFGRTDASLVD